MRVINREQAQSDGNKYYFTGKPCIRGHIAERKIAGGCTECIITSKQKVSYAIDCVLKNSLLHYVNGEQFAGKSTITNNHVILEVESPLRKMPTLGTIKLRTGLIALDLPNKANFSIYFANEYVHLFFWTLEHTLIGNVSIPFSQPLYNF